MFISYHLRIVALRLQRILRGKPLATRIAPVASIFAALQNPLQLLEVEAGGISDALFPGADGLLGEAPLACGLGLRKPEALASGLDTA